MYLFRLGKMPDFLSMVIFHELAREGIESLVIVSPSNPMITLGYFQDAEQEVDLDYIRQANLPLFRREVGGGTTYLDENQIFYQIIWSPKNPKIPSKIKEAYEVLSEPPCRAHHRFGIKASFREVNDLVVSDGRKIGGEGGANIGQMMVMVGSMMMDFDYTTMSRVAKIPDEKWRDKIYKSITENLTTMKRELGELPDRKEVEDILIDEYLKTLGPLEEAELNPDFLRRAKDLEARMLSPSFLFGRKKSFLDSFKVRSGLNIVFGQHKAKGGLIRTIQEVDGPPEGGSIADLMISGDFTLVPKESLHEGLERPLIGSPRVRYELVNKVEKFIERKDKEMPGVETEDILQALKVEP